MSKTQQKTEEKQKKEELCLKLFESQVVQKFKSTSFNDTHEKLLKFYCFCYFYSSLVHLKKAQIIKKSYIHEKDNEIILKHLRFQALLEYRMTFECALKSDNIFSVDTTKKYNIFSITRGLFSHDTKKLSSKASSYTQFFSQKTQQIKGYKKICSLEQELWADFLGNFSILDRVAIEERYVYDFFMNRQNIYTIKYNDFITSQFLEAANIHLQEYTSFLETKLKTKITNNEWKIFEACISGEIDSCFSDAIDIHEYSKIYFDVLSRNNYS